VREAPQFLFDGTNCSFIAPTQALFRNQQACCAFSHSLCQMLPVGNDPYEAAGF
jgi:hypothetical protein